MKKEIKGYKLKNEKYRKAAFYAGGFVGKYEDNSRHMEPFIRYMSKAEESLEEAGVLDLWFEPIYKEIEFKVGDICVNLGESGHYFKGEIGELEHFQNEYFTFKGKPQGEGYYKHKRYLRHATPEEIKEYRSLKLPKINGYEGKYDEVGEKLLYGCATLSAEWFKHRYNRGIKSMTLSSGVEINEEQIEQIRKFLNRKQK